jgi:hypothetical protein
VRLHGFSMLMYLGEVVMLIIGGLLLPHLIRQIAQDEARGRAA